MRLFVLLSIITSLASAGEYDIALDRAKEAFLIQTGFKAEVDRISRGATKIVNQELKSLRLDEPVGAALYCIKVVRDESVEFPVSSNKTVRVQMDGVYITIGF